MYVHTYVQFTYVSCICIHYPVHRYTHTYFVLVHTIRLYVFPLESSIVLKFRSDERDYAMGFSGLISLARNRGCTPSGSGVTKRQTYTPEPFEFDNVQVPVTPLCRTRECVSQHHIQSMQTSKSYARALTCTISTIYCGYVYVLYYLAYGVAGYYFVLLLCEM